MGLTHLRLLLFIRFQKSLSGSRFEGLITEVVLNQRTLLGCGLLELAHWSAQATSVTGQIT